MLKNFSLKTLLIVNFVFIVILLFAVGGISLYGLKQSNDSLRTVYDDRLVPINDLGSMRVFLQKNRVYLNRIAIFHDDSAVVTKALGEIEQNMAEWDRLWDKYLATYLTEEEKQLVATCKTAQQTYSHELINPALEAIKTQNYVELERLLKEQAPVVFPVIEKALDDINDLQPRVAKVEFDHAIVRYDLVFKLIMAAALVSSLIAIIGGWYLIRRIVNPVNGALEWVKRIARGNLDANVTVTHNDEIGKLLEAFKPMQDSLKGLISQMDRMASEHERGEIEVFIDASKFEGDFEAIASGINKMVGDHIAVKKKAVGVFKAFGEGDFEAQIENCRARKPSSMKLSSKCGQT